MADILKNERDFRQADLSSKQIIVIIFQLSICKVVPPEKKTVRGGIFVIGTELTCWRRRTEQLVISSFDDH